MNGNEARRFFKNTSVSNNITGVDTVVIKRFRNILKTIDSRYFLSLLPFKECVLKTAIYLLKNISVTQCH